MEDWLLPRFDNRSASFGLVYAQSVYLCAVLAYVFDMVSSISQWGYFKVLSRYALVIYGGLLIALTSYYVFHYFMGLYVSFNFLSASLDMLNSCVISNLKSVSSNLCFCKSIWCILSILMM